MTVSREQKNVERGSVLLPDLFLVVFSSDFMSPHTHTYLYPPLQVQRLIDDPSSGDHTGGAGVESGSMLMMYSVEYLMQHEGHSSAGKRQSCAV